MSKIKRVIDTHENCLPHWCSINQPQQCPATIQYDF